MKKDYKAFAAVSGKNRTRGMILPALLMLFCVGALMMCVYSFSSGNIVFGISYIIAVILGLSYIIIKLNQFYMTYIAADDENVVLKCWDNKFFPYNAWGGIPLIREFIPSHTEVAEIPMNDINKLYMGTKTFIKRNADDENFNKAVLPYEKHKYSNVTGMLDKMNILYIGTKQGDSCFMSVTGFDPKETMEVLNRFTRFCDDDVDIKINIRDFRRYLKRPISEKENIDNENGDNQSAESKSE